MCVLLKCCNGGMFCANILTALLMGTGSYGEVGEMSQMKGVDWNSIGNDRLTGSVSAEDLKHWHWGYFPMCFCRKVTLWALPSQKRRMTSSPLEKTLSLSEPRRLSVSLQSSSTRWERSTGVIREECCQHCVRINMEQLIKSNGTHTLCLHDRQSSNYSNIIQQGSFSSWRDYLLMFSKSTWQWMTCCRLPTIL